MPVTVRGDVLEAGEGDGSEFFEKGPNLVEGVELGRKRGPAVIVEKGGSRAREGEVVAKVARNAQFRLRVENFAQP